MVLYIIAGGIVMLNKKLKITIGLLIFLIFVCATILIKNKNKLELILKADDLNYSAYTLVLKNSILDRVDLEKSDFESLNVYISNDDFDEYEISKQITDIYKSFNLKLTDSNYIPIGKNVKLRYQAVKKDLKKEEIIEKTLNFDPKIVIYDYQEKLVDNQSTYIIASEKDLKEILNFKGFLSKFDKQAEEIKLDLSHNININKNDTYDLVIKNDLFAFKRQVVVTVKVPEIVKVEKKDTVIKKEPNKAVINIISDASLNSIDVLINKQNSLSATAVPPLKNFPSNYAISSSYLAQPVAVDGFIDLADTMKAETGMTVLVTSAYRSYNTQKDLFNRYVKRDGLALAQRYSARPGQSEHQSGLALDISKPNVSILNFDNSKESIWVAKNAFRFGFIIRYPFNKESITGYIYEPWHLRFLGVELATLVKNSNLTYDEYYALYTE